MPSCIVAKSVLCAVESTAGEVRLISRYPERRRLPSLHARQWCRRCILQLINSNHIYLHDLLLKKMSQSTLARTRYYCSRFEESFVFFSSSTIPWSWCFWLRNNWQKQRQKLFCKYAAVAHWGRGLWPGHAIQSPSRPSPRPEMLCTASSRAPLPSLCTTLTYYSPF